MSAMRGSAPVGSPLGVYIHIPFCTAKCPYCDFYSLPFTEAAADAYIEALGRALHHAPCSAGAPADTIYFGGGTPSLLGAARLGRLIQLVRDRFSLAPDAEITLEANPGTLQPAVLGQLLQAGFTRISFGVQSLQPAELEGLGRGHTAEQATATVTQAHSAGFRHISADLMLGVPQQTGDSLARTLDALCDLPVDHVSAYLLKIEEETPFGRLAVPPPLPDEDDTAALYLQCVAALGQAGFAQYEISNFAKEGGESRHNLKYWRCEAYLGLGPAAHSFVDGHRFAFPRDLPGFINAPDPFALAVPDGDGGGWEEYAMLRLRLAEGLDLAALSARYGVDARPMLEQAKLLARRGLVTVAGDTIALTPEGFLLSNRVTAALLF